MRFRLQPVRNKQIYSGKRRIKGDTVLQVDF